ncbi:integral membrane protein [Colletotrichum karsti]|uniref:Integral membrane protein n=1 Tax=Colletotrichum karsti TaxID=1095194 RepID=A0A9P6LIN3_9PEZI|nr:uncharacterized protein CkaCkLH20_08649 [Colletotrichum karsti]KAF9873915.1 integral membrane protein [Colletotrichum karsti]
MPVIKGILTVLPAPEGYAVDFANPQRQAVPDAFYVAGIGSVLSLLLMAQRLYTKAFLVGKLQVDDDMFAVGAGGVHGWEIPVEKFNIFMLDVFLAAPIYTLCGSFAKVSLLIFYVRLSPQRWFKCSVLITLAVIICYSLGIFFALVFACDPIAMNWDATITEGTCINRPALYIATAVANIVSDIMLFALPLPIVVKLQIPRRQKIGLFFIFAVGSLTVVTSIVRVSLLPAMLTSLDQSWAISYASLWIIIEANLLIICAALPTLRRFLRHVAPKIIGESTYGKGTKKTDPGSKHLSRMTIGGTKGTRNRNEYSEFDRDNSPETFVMTSVGTSKPEVDNTANSEHDAAWQDDSSEKAIIYGNTIVQTKTVTVEYSSSK